MRPWMVWLVVVALAAVAGVILGTEWFVVLLVLTVASWGVWALIRGRIEMGNIAATAAAVAVVFLLAQLVPFGRSHTNPPVTAEPQWDSAETRAFAVRACFDCHSNETEWPWYTSVAPISWVTQRHVDEGRATLNYSEWDRPQEEAGESAETVEDREMPLFDYLLVHPNARLSDAEQQRFIDGLVATFGRDD